MKRSTLDTLYPFLSEAPAQPRAQRQALLDSIAKKADDSVEAKRRFFRDNAEGLLAVADALATVFVRGGRLLTMGNGGSSCDAAHIAVEFLHPVTAGRPGLPAIDLTADRTAITALANDVGFEHVFARQVAAIGQPQDALLGVSTSGRSPNLMAAFAAAKRLGATTIGLVGMSGGDMVESPDVDHCLVVRSDSVHRIQEVQVATYHVLWDLVHTVLAATRRSRRTP